MRRRAARGGVLRAAALALVCCTATVVASAQAKLSEIEIAPHIAETVRVSVEPTWSAFASGGFGWVTIGLQNDSTEAQDLQVVIQESYRRTAYFKVETPVRLAPKSGQTLHLPLLTGIRGMLVSVTLDRDPRRAMRDYFYPASGVPEGFGCTTLLVTDDPESARVWTTALQTLDQTDGLTLREQHVHRNGRMTPQVMHPIRELIPRDPSALPRDWRLWSGFDFVMIDGRTAVDTELQAVIADYLATGGAVVSLGVAGLRAGGVLRDVFGEVGTSDACVGVHGFGRWLVLSDEAVRNPQRAVTTAKFAPWLARVANRVGKGSALAGPIPREFAPDFALAGVGEVPLGWIFAILLTFAVVVGPFNYFYWRRRRRLAMLLVTVPAAGFLVTALILLFGLLAQGLGIRGAVDSLTLLDQRDHRAVTWSTRHLFAGMTPARIVPADSTHVSSPNMNSSRYLEAHRLEIEMDGGSPTMVMAGNLLPARYETQLETAEIRAARQRLRFRERADGAVDVLMGAEFQLAGDDTVLVLHAPDGRWFVGGRDGIARPDPDASQRAERLVRQLFEGADDAAWAAHRDLLCDLPPGSYVAQVALEPTLDTLALDVDWQRRRHVVRGVLGAEDWSHE